MDLLKPQDIFRNNRSLLAGGDYFAKFLMYILRFDRLNKVYRKVVGKQGIEFIDELIKTLEFNIEFDTSELKKIPKEGPLIVVANHPLGGFDGLLLIKYLSMVRSDVKVLASFLLKKVEPVSEYFLSESLADLSSESDDFVGAKEAAEHLKQNGVLCLFPAIDINTKETFDDITDKVWQYPVVNFIKKAEVPVVPVLFQGSNSRLLQLAARIHPALKQARLPSEILSKRNKNIKIRFGGAIPVQEQAAFTDTYQFGRFLRARVYSMQSDIEVKRFFNYSLKRAPKVEPVADPVPQELILREVNSLRNEYMLFQLKNYTAFCAPSSAMPNILNEIGRLREITFRDVGEGTNRSIDLDEFDLYYYQMFIWDEDEKKIVGAYRMGKGRDILEQYGRRGFYIHSLFRLGEELKPMLAESMELGRSFVVKEYQRKPMPLFLLWKGILYFLLKNPEYRYLIGPVSISNNYSKVSKDLIIKFIMKNHFDWKLGRYVKPRNSYRFKSDNADLNLLMENMQQDINRLDKIISDVDELNTGLPVLLKKYIKLNARIIGFNVDPKFNNCLDGLIVLDVFDVPPKTIESLSKEVNDGSILDRFYGNRETEESAG